VPVYIVGLAAGMRIFATFSWSWWLSVVATTAVAFLLIPAGIYLLVPAIIAACVLARHGAAGDGRGQMPPS